VDTAGRIWEGDSVQLATKEVGLKLILWMRGAGRIPRQRSDWRVNLTAGGCECNRDLSPVGAGAGLISSRSLSSGPLTPALLVRDVRGRFA